jgi:dolichol-phosphate mannosyltransferase
MATYKCVSGKKTLRFKKLYRCLKGRKKVSIIIPTYKEEETIKKLVMGLHNVMHGKDYEIIIVDDFSPDRTPEVIDELARKSKDRGEVIALHRNIRNMFTAIKDGTKISRGEIFVFMDADLTHPVSMVPKLLEYMNEYDLVSASRLVKGGKLASSPIHTLLSKMGNKLCEIILHLPVKDPIGGFNAIRRSKFNQLKFKHDFVWGEFNLELFYRANKNGMKIKELPYVYKTRSLGTSKSKDFVYGWRYLFLAFRLMLFG